MRGFLTAGVCLAGAATLLCGSAQAMNKAELIDAIAKSAKLTKADAGRVVDSFSEVTAAALKKGDRISLVGFGSFSVSKRVNSEDSCGTINDVDFFPGSGFIYAEVEEPLNDVNCPASAPYKCHLGNCAVNAQACIKACDGTTEDDVVAELVKQAQLNERIVRAALNAMLDIIINTVNSGEEVAIAGFGSYFEEAQITMETVEPCAGLPENCPEAQAAKKKAVPRKKVAIAAEGLNDAELKFLMKQAETLAARVGRNPQTGKEIKIAAKNVVKFKAGAELADKVN
jgi:nucleoid DNA-binding protein